MYESLFVVIKSHFAVFYKRALHADEFADFRRLIL